jgi:hypothetical protein
MLLPIIYKIISISCDTTGKEHQSSEVNPLKLRVYDLILRMLDTYVNLLLCITRPC